MGGGDADFLAGGIIPALPNRLLVRKELAVNHIRLDAQDEAVKRFFLSLPVDPRGSVLELEGHAVACILPLSPESGGGAAPAEWTEAKNARRCALIDREIDETLTPEEAVELHRLQGEMLYHRRQAASLPLEDARRLHQRRIKGVPNRERLEDGAMTQITLDATLSGTLHSLGQAVELCDPSGKVLGRFVPLIDLSEWEPGTPEAGEEELDRREQSTDWYSTEEVLAHLKNLEKQ